MCRELGLGIPEISGICFPHLLCVSSTSRLSSSYWKLRSRAGSAAWFLRSTIARWGYCSLYHVVNAMCMYSGVVQMDDDQFVQQEPRTLSSKHIRQKPCISIYSPSRCLHRRSAGLENYSTNKGPDSGTGGTGTGGGIAAETSAGAASTAAVSVDHKAMFRPTLIIEFAEDSPAFRRNVEALESNVEGGIMVLIISPSRMTYAWAVSS